MTPRQLLVPLLLVLSLPAPAPAHADGRCGKLSLERVRREPDREPLTPARLEELRGRVRGNLRDRGARFDLVKALMDAGQLKEALAEARAWRARDAYNLVVVRLLGDLYVQLGDLTAARRAYSAVVELLSGDPASHRALASVMRESGDLQGAYDRLVAASRLQAGDQRTAFELADAAHRLGRGDEAVTRFRTIIEKKGADESVSYPARQRLAQLYQVQRRAATARGATAEAKRLEQAIAALQLKGGVVNDVKIFLTWDTDRTDVDLWVTTPDGEEIMYNHKQGRGGEELFYDVTAGYGPESFTAHEARCGTYKVQVDYFGTRRTGLTEARGEVIVILNEGSEHEQRHVLPYKLFEPKQRVTVARIKVQ